MKQGNHAAREYLNGKLKDDKNWTFSNQEHEWCVRNASFDPLMKDDVYDLFLKYLTVVDAKHRDRVRDGANVVIDRMKRALSVLEEFPTQAEEVITRRMLLIEGQGAPDGEKKKKKKEAQPKEKKERQRWRKSRSAEIVLLVYRILAFNNHNNIVTTVMISSVILPFLRYYSLEEAPLHLIHDRKSWQLSKDIIQRRS